MGLSGIRAVGKSTLGLGIVEGIGLATRRQRGEGKEWLDEHEVEGKMHNGKRGSNRLVENTAGGK
jgi:hypothetical protein